MRVGKTRETLLDDIQPLLTEISQDDKNLEEVMSNLSKHKITSGTIISYLNDDKELENAPIEDLLLLGHQLMTVLKGKVEGESWLKSYLSSMELKQLRNYKKVNESDETLALPLVLNDAIRIRENEYLAIVPHTLIAKMYKSGLLHYNPNIQREAKRKKVGDSIIEVPKLNPVNIAEIAKQAENDELFPTTLYYNCQPLTGEAGVELSYDARSRKLIVHAGTIIDILEGAHRTNGIYAAYMKKQNLNGSMPVVFFNYTEEQVKRFQVDLAKATPISKGRIKQLAEARYADHVVKQLAASGELKNRITSSERVSYSLGEVVTYSTLSDAIERFFPMNSRLEALEVVKPIDEYITYLFGYYNDHLQKDSLLFTNKMFMGHMYLAARMKENNIPYSELRTYLDKVDFSRKAPIWTDSGVLVNNNMSRKSEKGILEVFQKNIWGQGK